MAAPRVATILHYMEDSHLLERIARVLHVESKNNKVNVITDTTIFYPQGGGQPYDQGEMVQTGTGARFFVREVFFDAATGQVQHLGDFDASTPTPFNVGDEVTQKVDGTRRAINRRNHSAGHLLALAVRTLGLPIIERKGYHFTDGPYVEFEGKLQDVDGAKNQISKVLNQIISENHDVKWAWMAKEDLAGACDVVPEQLPENKPVRVVTVSGFKGCPCGGTHVTNTSEVGHVDIRKINIRKNMTKISYAIA